MKTEERMATEPKLKRITVKYKNPNPLFEKWLTEWLEHAQAQDSKMQHIFRNALITLKKYPLPLDTGRDCIILNGFGRKLCDMLDKKLAHHKSSNQTNLDVFHNENKEDVCNDCEMIDSDNANVAEIPATNSKQNATTSTENISPESQRTAIAKRKTYKPVKRSGPYAILLVLYKNSKEANYVGYMTKSEIIEQAKQFCDKSFIKPDTGSYYTAWSSMSLLIRKEYVSKIGQPAKFSLTHDGTLAAASLFENEECIVSNNHNINFIQTDSIYTNNILVTQEVQCEQRTTQLLKTNKVTNSKRPKEEISSNQCSVIATDTFIFAPGTFDVILLVDTHETSGTRTNPEYDETISELSALNVRFEVRHLKVGDFTWICREKSTNRELVLPYIVERKRIDDLGQSIKDGRFHEQKFRLKQCRIKNVIYVIESHNKNSHTGLPLSALMQAASNTLIQDRFQVKFTQNHRHSMQYLSGFTAILSSTYEGKTLMACNRENIVESSISHDLISLMKFEEFNKGASKSRNFRLREIFARQLLQLKGLSVEKVIAIIDKYPCPKLLTAEYDKMGKQGEKLLANIQYGTLKRFIGPVISTSIYQLYTRHKLL